MPLLTGDTDGSNQAGREPSFLPDGTPWVAQLLPRTEGLPYLVAQLPVFAGSSLNGEYIPSRNVLDLEKHSGIFQIWDLGPDWICKQTKRRPRKERKRRPQRTGCCRERRCTVTLAPGQTPAGSGGNRVLVTVMVFLYHRRKRQALFLLFFFFVLLFGAT